MLMVYVLVYSTRMKILFIFLLVLCIVNISLAGVHQHVDESDTKVLEEGLTHDLAAIEYYANGKFILAAKEYEKAAKAYEKLEKDNDDQVKETLREAARRYKHTALGYRQAGYITKYINMIKGAASMYEQLAIKYQNDNYYSLAAENYNEAGKRNKAIEMYIQTAKQYTACKMHDMATEMRLKAEELQRDLQG